MEIVSFGIYMLTLRRRPFIEGHSLNMLKTIALTTSRQAELTTKFANVEQQLDALEMAAAGSQRASHKRWHSVQPSWPSLRIHRLYVCFTEVVNMAECTGHGVSAARPLI